jgi:hypothetical protein
MEKESMYGEMQVIMMDNGPTIRLLGLEHISGLMGANTLVIGSITKCTAQESILGKMEEDTKDNINLIRSMDLASIHGLMDDNTLENGLIASAMVKEKSFRLMVLKDKEFGNKIRELVGLMIILALLVIAMQNLLIAKYFDIYSFRSFISFLYLFQNTL